MEMGYKENMKTTILRLPHMSDTYNDIHMLSVLGHRLKPTRWFWSHYYVNGPFFSFSVFSVVLFFQFNILGHWKEATLLSFLPQVLNIFSGSWFIFLVCSKTDCISSQELHFCWFNYFKLSVGNSSMFTAMTVSCTARTL